MIFISIGFGEREGGNSGSDESAARQIGLPLQTPLFLLAAGALAAAGELGLVLSPGLSIIACVLADWVWYEAGRRKGDKVLHFFTASREILTPTIVGRKESLPGIGLHFCWWLNSFRDWMR